jgi:hypothetical protein
VKFLAVCAVSDVFRTGRQKLIKETRKYLKINVLRSKQAAREMICQGPLCDTGW